MKHFTHSENMRAEYSCQVVRIRDIAPIANSDHLATTIVSGNTIVIDRDEFKEGDYAIYAKNETALNKEFLSINNLFSLEEYELNSNSTEIGLLLQEQKTDEAKGKVGFFGKNGRVRMIKLRGVYSMGFIFKLDAIAKWHPEVSGEDLTLYMLNEEMGIGEDFDTVCGDIFVKAYIPHKTSVKRATEKKNEFKRQKRIKLFERIADSDWKFHYDTLKANDSIWMIDTQDVVNVSVKMHGTSFCCGNIKIKYPAKLTTAQKIWNCLANTVQKISVWLNEKTTPTWYEDYGHVYSSRNVIKNKFINKNKGMDFYGSDVWGDINALISPYIPEGMMLYGEICGYVTNTDKMIQKGYDYGCEMGENFLMPYRITTIEWDGETREWNVDEVVSWTNQLVIDHPELKGRIRPMTVLFHGPLTVLYPHVSTERRWHENILEEMKKDKKRLGMESNEVLCKNKVPREGICIRVDDRPIKCMKLKTMSFFNRESKEIDCGNIDMETAGTYSEEKNNSIPV